MNCQLCAAVSTPMKREDVGLNSEAVGLYLPPGETGRPGTLVATGTITLWLALFAQCAPVATSCSFSPTSTRRTSHSQQLAATVKRNQSACLIKASSSGHLLWALLSSFASCWRTAPRSPRSHTHYKQPSHVIEGERDRERAVHGAFARCREVSSTASHISTAETHRPASLPEQGQAKHRCAVRQASRRPRCPRSWCSSTGVASGKARPETRPRTCSLVGVALRKPLREGEQRVPPPRASRCVEARARVDGCAAI